MADEYDVIIVGSGAGGGTLAHRLAPSGKRVLILERGDWLDFGELQHHGGLSPAWPVGYDVFEPYYTQAEQLYQVHGARGEDPTDPPAGAPYPFPPVSHEVRIQQLFDDLSRVGLHPFHAPCGIMLDEANPEFSTCIRCATCDGFPCLVHAKSRRRCDRGASRAAPRQRHPRAQRHRPEAGNRPRWADRHHGGRRRRRRRTALHRVGGRSERGRGQLGQLLLASANDTYPNGLANGSDQVGRNYMFHNSRAFLAVSEEKNDTRFQKTLGLNDHYVGDDEFGYPMGNVQMVGKSSAPMYRGEKPIETALAPTFALDQVAEHAVDFWLSSEDLPDADNRVTLDTEGNIVLSYTRNNREPLEHLYHRVKRQLSHLGMHPHHLIPRDVYMKNDIPLAGCAHQAGTARFGTDPATAVLDPDCKAHELDNLYVVDTSFFPSIGAVNPALTAIANALRVGDHLVSRLG